MNLANPLYSKHLPLLKARILLSAGIIKGIDLGNGDVSLGRTVVAAALGGATSVLGGGKFGNGAATAAFAYTFGSLARSAQQYLRNQLNPDQRKIVEYLEKQGVFREANEPFIFEKVASNCNSSVCVGFEPSGYAGLVDDLGLHEGFQQRLPSLSRSGEFHLSFQRFEGTGTGIYVHYDSISAMKGPIHTVRHVLQEVLPNLSRPRIIRDDYMDYGR